MRLQFIFAFSPIHENATTKRFHKKTKKNKVAIKKAAVAAAAAAAAAEAAANENESAGSRDTGIDLDLKPQTHAEDIGGPAGLRHRRPELFRRQSSPVVPSGASRGVVAAEYEMMTEEAEQDDIVSREQELAAGNNKSSRDNTLDWVRKHSAERTDIAVRSRSQSGIGERGAHSLKFASSNADQATTHHVFSGVAATSAESQRNLLEAGVPSSSETVRIALGSRSDTGVVGDKCKTADNDDEDNEHQIISDGRKNCVGENNEDEICNIEDVVSSPDDVDDHASSPDDGKLFTPIPRSHRRHRQSSRGATLLDPPRSSRRAAASSAARQDVADQLVETASIANSNSSLSETFDSSLVSSNDDVEIMQDDVEVTTQDDEAIIVKGGNDHKGTARGKAARPTSLVSYGQPPGSPSWLGGVAGPASVTSRNVRHPAISKASDIVSGPSHDVVTQCESEEDNLGSIVFPSSSHKVLPPELSHQQQGKRLRKLTVLISSDDELQASAGGPSSSQLAALQIKHPSSLSAKQGSPEKTSSSRVNSLVTTEVTGHRQRKSVVKIRDERLLESTGLSSNESDGENTLQRLKGSTGSPGVVGAACGQASNSQPVSCIH